MRSTKVKEVEEIEDLTINVKKKDKKSEPVKKETGAKGKVGRKKVEDKKKPRQVYLNDAEFKEIENIANEEMIDTKTLLLKAVKKYVKDSQDKTLEELVKEAEEA